MASSPSPPPVGPVPTVKRGTLRIPYQCIWFDFAVADGEYSPEDLRRARKVVKAWGAVRFYTLTTPEG